MTKLPVMEIAVGNIIYKITTNHIDETLPFINVVYATDQIYSEVDNTLADELAITWTTKEFIVQSYGVFVAKGETPSRSELLQAALLINNWDNRLANGMTSIHKKSSECKHFSNLYINSMTFAGTDPTKPYQIEHTVRSAKMNTKKLKPLNHDSMKVAKKLFNKSYVTFAMNNTIYTFINHNQSDFTGPDAIEFTAFLKHYGFLDKFLKADLYEPPLPPMEYNIFDHIPMSSPEELDRQQAERESMTKIYSFKTDAERDSWLKNTKLKGTFILAG